MNTCVLATAAVLFCCGPLQAERYAVLAGISGYRDKSIGLEGPANDIEVLETTLRKLHGYSAAHITVLLDRSATRDAILAALRRRVEQMAAGDHLLFYFSGHGTSAFDDKFQPLATYIGPDSGALAPHDLDLSSAEAAAGSLLIGRRDLRPILSAVPKGAQALVILDACYSENAARSLGSLASAPSRGISLSSLVKKERREPVEMTGEDEPYPYPNVIAMAAASRRQPALDLNKNAIRAGNLTFDGRPHGAFTNSFLAGLQGRADTNRDGAMTYEELYRFIRRDMERFPQTPQMLVREGFPLDAPALGAHGSRIAPETATAREDNVRIRLEGVRPALEEDIARLSGVDIAATGYSLLLRQTDTAHELFDRSGTLIRSYALDDTASVLERIRAQAALSELTGWRRDWQPFNVTLDVEPEDARGYERYRATYRVGERLHVRMRTERTAWLLLLNIDKNGRVSVLFPGASPDEQGAQNGGAMVEVSGIRVHTPAGSEHLRLFAFASRPANWNQWTCSRVTVDGTQRLECPDFDPADRRVYNLLNMIRAAGDSAAETSLRVVTNE